MRPRPRRRLSALLGIPAPHRAAQRHVRFAAPRRHLAGTALAGLPVHISEFNTSYRPDNPVHDTAYNAAYLAPVLAAGGDLVDSFSYWTVSDVFEEEGVPAYDELIYVANPERMDADKIRRFLHATERAVQYIVNHPEKAWEIFAATSAELRDRLNEMAWADTYPRFATRPASLDHGRYRRFERFLRDAGLIARETPVAGLARDLNAQ
jgi:hypothetical protein